MNKILIIGGNSQISANLRASNTESLYTSRKKNSAIYFDLIDKKSFINIESVIKQEKIQNIIFLAAETSIDRCEKDSTYTSLINVTNTCFALKKLSDLGCFTIFLSSNHVFNCSAPFIDKDSMYDPFSIYGEQKLAVEKFVKKHNLNVAIIRPTKIITKEFNLINSLRTSLSAGCQFDAFDDHFIAPISMEFLVKRLFELLNKPQTGFYQLSGDTDVSYYQLCSIIAKNENLNTNLITPIKAASRGVKATQFGSLKPFWIESSENNFQPLEKVIDFIYEGKI